MLLDFWTSWFLCFLFCFYENPLTATVCIGEFVKLIQYVNKKILSCLAVSNHLIFPKLTNICFFIQVGGRCILWVVVWCTENSRSKFPHNTMNNPSICNAFSVLYFLQMGRAKCFWCSDVYLPTWFALFFEKYMTHKCYGLSTKIYSKVL